MKADELEQRLKNALIYGTSHPEIYMTKADELWEKYVGNGVMITRDDFLAALSERDAYVKKECVRVCKDMQRGWASNDHLDCAAAIEKMELL